MLFLYSYLQLCCDWINELIYYLYMSIYCWCHYHVTVILINSLTVCLWFLCGTLNVKLVFFVASFVSIKVFMYSTKKLVTITVRDLLYMLNESRSWMLKFRVLFLQVRLSIECVQMQKKNTRTKVCHARWMFSMGKKKSPFQIFYY